MSSSSINSSFSGGGSISGMGKVHMWGLSPALNLLQYLDLSDFVNSSSGEKHEINILLVGQTDMRHVLETLAQNSDVLQSKNIMLNFYLAEDFLEQYARQLLFWSLATQPLSQIGLGDKCAQFMEIFGNTLVRPQTKNNFMIVTKKLIEVLTNPNLLQSEMQELNLSELKFRERDDLVELLKHWRNFMDPSVYSIDSTWKNRVVKQLGVRYDVRLNVFDWDYNMKLKENGGGIVSSSEYKKWRETGIGFADFDSCYTIPNLTLVTGISNRGKIQLNYWGDILTGPFIPYGIESETQKFFERANERFKHSAYDITLNNLQRIFKKICTNNDADKSLINYSDFMSINFISPATFARQKFESKYSSKNFHGAFFGIGSAQYILPSICSLLLPDSIVFVESTNFALEFRADQSKLYNEKVSELGKAGNLQPIILQEINLKFRANQNSAPPPSILTFTKTRPSDDGVNEAKIEKISPRDANDESNLNTENEKRSKDKEWHLLGDVRSEKDASFESDFSKNNGKKKAQSGDLQKP